MFKQIVKDCLVGFDNMPINDEQLDRIERFADILLEKNKVMNLTAVREKNEVARRHMADSLFLLKCTELKGKKILDIGTGPGFPGMPSSSMILHWTLPCWIPPASALPSSKNRRHSWAYRSRLWRPAPKKLPPR